MFLGFPSKPGEGKGDATSRCSDSKGKSKLAAWPQEKGPQQTNKRKQPIKKQTPELKKHKSLRSLHPGSTSPSSELQACLPCSLQTVSFRTLEMAESLRHSNERAAGRRPAGRSQRTRLCPSAKTTFHQGSLSSFGFTYCGFLDERALWVKKKIFLIKIWLPLTSTLQDP